MKEASSAKTTSLAPGQPPPVVSLVSLGCAKNDVDSERILGVLATEGFLIAENPEEADICLVNTCGFIRESREESEGVLRELQALKATGSLKSVVALGCLVERVAGAEETSGYLDAADARIGFNDYPRLAAICRSLADGESSTPGAGEEGTAVTIGDKRFKGLSAAAGSFTESYQDFLAAPRLRIGSPHIAHLKISEGCSNFCRFCSIPYIRGVQVSRPMEEIEKEARQLIDSGAVELSLIAQDTTSYGRDLYGSLQLANLLRRLLTIEGELWFRLMYAFPRFLDSEMLDVMASDDRVCPYIDMPLQHISDRMLSVMGRGMSKRATLDLLDLIRTKLPEGAIRTTFIVGHPGETDACFEELLAFVQEGRFSHVGVFLYSSEPRTPSAKMEDVIPLAEKKRRRDALMLAQLEVSRRRLAERVGSVIPVMVDGPLVPGTSAPRGVTAMGRSRLEASDVDGSVFLKGRAVPHLPSGTVRQVRVTQALDYDLVGELATSS